MWAILINRKHLISKSNVKILQYKQNIWKENYRYTIKYRIFKKWHCMMTV